MNELEKTLEHAESCLSELLIEQIENRERILRMEADIKLLRERQRKLESFHTGLIPSAKRDIEEAERKLQDSKLRKVVWIGPPRWSLQASEAEYVVVKVTKKRIYIRKAGSFHRDCYYEKETGTGKSKFDGQINLPATFPEGVENYKT